MEVRFFLSESKSASGSVSRLIIDAKEKDPLAAQHLFERYWDGLLRVARRRMARTSLRSVDEEDVALSAFHSFFRGANAGRFPQLEDRHDLWRILLTISHRKVAGYVRAGAAEKRSVTAKEDENRKSASREDWIDIEDLISHEPTPEIVAATAETIENLVQSLPDQHLRKIAQLKLEGYESKEIADILGCTLRTVQRKIERIQVQWRQQLTDE